MRGSRLRPPVVVLVGAGLALVAAILSLSIGVVHVPFGEVLHDLVGGDAVDSGLHRTLILQMRLPRTVGALCVGAALGTAGCILHSLLRNPLASPSVIGASQAAGLGVVIGIHFAFPYLAALSLAFACSVSAAFLVLALSRGRNGRQADSVVLAGLNLSLLFGALIGLFQYLSRDASELSRMVLWILGGLWQVTWDPLVVMVPLTVTAVTLAILLARRLDLLALGDTDARRLGLDVERTGTALLLLACFLTSLAVCVAGVVAFVGLVVPHAARRIVGSSHAVLLPASAFLGGVLVVATDSIARTIVPPNELPLGVVTSILGVPTFLVLMRSQARVGVRR